MKKIINWSKFLVILCCGQCNGVSKTETIKCTSDSSEALEILVASVFTCHLLTPWVLQVALQKCGAIFEGSM